MKKLSVELLLVAAITGILMALRWNAEVSHFAEIVLSSRRAALYGTLASVAGSLLGFVITSAAILLTLHPTFKNFHGTRSYTQLWDVFRDGMWSLAVATTTSIVALVLDADSRPNWLVCSIACASVVVAVSRVASCIYRLHQAIEFAIAPTSRREPGSDR